MSGNRLLTAIVVLAGLLAVTVWQWNKRDAEDLQPAAVSVKLAKVKKDDVSELSVAAPGKPSVTLKKVDGAWKVTAPLQADADKDSVDAALSKLEELEVVAVAATRKENHEKLEVTESKAVHVVAKQGDKLLSDILIGAYRSGNTMVREQGAENVATVKGSIKYAFDKDLKDWRDRVVVEATADQVKAVTFQNKNGTFKFVKEGTEWKQAPGEKPIAKFDGGKIVSLVGTATSLRALDFAADTVTADAAGVGTTPIGTVTLTTGADAGDKQLVVRIGNKIDSGYYAFREGKTPIYTISDFSGERLVPSIDKFVKDETKPTAAAPSGGNNPMIGGGGPDLAEMLKHAHPPAGH